MEELLRYVLTEAALKIQRLWRKYCLRGIMGLGKKSRTDIWLVKERIPSRQELSRVTRNNIQKPVYTDQRRPKERAVGVFEKPQGHASFTSRYSKR